MADFTSRRMAFENKYAHDEALRFKAMSRRNRLLGLRGSSANQAQKPQPMPAQWSWPISRKPETRTSFARSSVISMGQVSPLTRARCAASWRASWTVQPKRSKPAHELS
jgi:hypothetical protein